MRRHLCGTIAIALLLLTLFASAAAAAFPIVQTSISQAPNGDVTFGFTYTESSPPDPAYPWTGFDVYRRSVDDCGPEVRISDQPYPRVSNFAEVTHLDHPPAGHAYRYRLQPVDASRQFAAIGPCDCSVSSYVSTSVATIPVVIGRLNIDVGWAYYIQPCLGSCYVTAHIPHLPELEAYVGTQTTFKFYGTMSCESLEGCGITLDHYELVSNCEAVPTRRTSWGEMKTIYR